MNRTNKVIAMKDQDRTRCAGIAATAHHFATIVVAAWAMLGNSPPAAAEGAGSATPIPTEEMPRQRTRRWWLDTWSHSMQEKLFVSWMNAETGGTAWQLTMTPSQVNALYAWWLQAVWPTL